VLRVVNAELDLGAATDDFLNRVRSNDLLVALRSFATEYSAHG
jgi:hypothetical protein